MSIEIQTDTISVGPGAPGQAGVTVNGAHCSVIQPPDQADGTPAQYTIFTPYEPQAFDTLSAIPTGVNPALILQRRGVEQLAVHDFSIDYPVNTVMDRVVRRGRTLVGPGHVTLSNDYFSVRFPTWVQEYVRGDGKTRFAITDEETSQIIAGSTQFSKYQEDDLTQHFVPDTRISSRGELGHHLSDMAKDQVDRYAESLTGVPGQPYELLGVNTMFNGTDVSSGYWNFKLGSTQS